MGVTEAVRSELASLISVLDQQIGTEENASQSLNKNHFAQLVDVRADNEETGFKVNTVQTKSIIKATFDILREMSPIDRMVMLRSLLEE